MRQRVTIAIAVLLLAAASTLAAASQLSLEISGMHCGGCATGIRAMLVRTEGVLKAEVSYEERLAQIDYDAAKTSPEKIVAAVEKMGYKARVKK